MPNITTCTSCGSAYEAGSEEQANERHRWCGNCRVCKDCGAKNALLGTCSAEEGPLCSDCVKAHNERHAKWVWRGS